ncbi:MAG: RNA 2',3'-cyclic phosphodiesterase [Elusimicrobia bacterium]|nr:RNA 2',3'-cyclic phosphodiesterase [Elusimicrobiota bacterium]
MRLFFAVALSADARRLLACALESLAASGADAKWVREDSMHLTLAFLGEVSPERLEAARRAGSRAAQALAAYRMDLGTLGAFPSWKAARVVWAGVRAGAAETCALAKALRKALAEEGFAREERDFVAHVTIGRVRSVRKASQLASAAQAWSAEAAGRWQESGTQVEDFSLIESRLTPQGPRYEDVERFPLTGGVRCA